MKTFFVLLFALVWMKPAMAQYSLEAKEKERMAKARVKTQTQWTHDFVDGKPSAKGYKSSVTTYDARGNVTEIINYNEAGEVISTVVTQYDSRDNKVNYERYQGNRKNLQYSQKTVYDANGNKIREYGFDGVTVYSNTYKYDADGKLSEINYTADNAPVEKRVWKYAGNKTEISIFDPRNQLTFKQENTYNSQGLLVSEIKLGNAGNMVHSLNMQYNNVGDLMEEIRMRAGEKLDYQKLYQYDAANRPVKEEIVNTDGTRYVSHEYQYSPQDDLTVETWKKNGRAKEPNSKAFIYDARGLYTEVESYFASYQLKSLYKYVYELY